jgi:UDPglucose--hexose-1-phosphate uridylyltransferase
MGLAVLPARLKDELEHLKDAMVAGRDISSDEELGKHAAWVEELKTKYPAFTRENIDRIIEDEVGLVFSKVLEHAGVYKRTEEGQQAFLRFADAVNA